MIGSKTYKLYQQKYYIIQNLIEMIKAEEKFDQLSETESESSTDSQNPFNVYVQMYKKSTKTDMDVKLAQLNTRTSN